MIRRKGVNVLTTAFAVIFAFGSVVYTSCKKENTTQPVDNKCVGVVCQNGGSCVEGVCYCAVGYEGEKCDKASISRYLGEWDVTETIAGSTKPANIGKINYYTIKVRKGSMALDILIDNFMGGGYNNIAGVIGRKYVGTALESDAVTKFVINANQTIAGTYITILKGAGRINDVGSEISCDFNLTYLESGKVVRDSVSFIASYKQ